MEHASRVIGKLAGPCVEDVLERTAWGLNGCRRSLATVCVGVEIAFAPFVEMATRLHRRFAPRNVRDEALPLILQRDQSTIASSWPARCSPGISAMAPAIAASRFGAGVNGRVG